MARLAYSNPATDRPSSSATRSAQPRWPPGTSGSGSPMPSVKESPSATKRCQGWGEEVSGWSVMAPVSLPEHQHPAADQHGPEADSQIPVVDRQRQRAGREVVRHQVCQALDQQGQGGGDQPAGVLGGDGGPAAAASGLGGRSLLGRAGPGWVLRLLGDLVPRALRGRGTGALAARAALGALAVLAAMGVLIA